MKPIMFIDRDEDVSDVDARRKGCLITVVAGSGFFYAMYEFLKFMFG
jgi:hypothetical protein